MIDEVRIRRIPLGELPIGRECLFKSDEFLQEFVKSLEQSINGEDVNPYEVGFGSTIVIDEVNEKNIEASWYPNTITRYHEISISIPIEYLVECIDLWEHSIKPHLFVKKDWHEQLLTKEYSVFVLIDASYFKNSLRNNDITTEKMLSLRRKLDVLASENSDVAFISFADSLIVKSNWKLGYFRADQESTYNPETIFDVIRKIREIYRSELDLEIYAVLTQGNNEYSGEGLLHISESKNHICLNSLGIPFAELIAIESSAKRSLKKGIHKEAEIYMDEQYFYSINMHHKVKDTIPFNEYKAIMKDTNPRYYYTDLDLILENLENE